MPDDEQIQESSTPDSTPEPDPAKARIEALEKEIEDSAPLVEIGRKQHRESLRTSIIGKGASLVNGADEAFDVLLAATATKLSINIDRPLSDDNRRKLTAALYNIARPLVVPHQPTSTPGNFMDRNRETPPKRGL